MSALVLVGFFVLGWFALSRANELCLIEIRDGAARLVRGRAPSRLLFDVGEIARRARLPRAKVRVVRSDGTPHLRVSGAVSDGVRQQLRNVVGEHQLAHFRAGRRAGS